jgi:hypothetical protein
MRRARALLRQLGRTIAAAEQYNEPGRFTAFIGYEWTSNTGGNNLHRNVIFRDNGEKASQVLPFTTQAPMGSDKIVKGWLDAKDEPQEQVYDVVWGGDRKQRSDG